MPKSINIEVPDFDYVDFKVRDGEVVHQYKLVYDYAAIKAAEDTTGIDLKDVREWSKVKSQHMPALVHAGLRRHHPEVTVDDVNRFLSPASQTAIQDAIFELLFPGLIAKIQEAKSKESQSPNA